jgi:hypothetical protein
VRQQHIAALRSKTFRQFADEFILSRRSRHRNQKAAEQWGRTVAPVAARFLMSGMGG